MEILLDAAYVFPAIKLLQSPADTEQKVLIAFVLAAGFAFFAGLFALYYEAIEYFKTGSE
jgi:ABC-type nitrate/sulfonate/bicarbonate transport system permease component